MDQEKFRVLIVDDDRTIRDLLAEALTEEGFTSATAANGVEALASIEVAQPNLVLLDIQMPKMDGRAFLHALAKNRIRIPVIVMSAAFSPRSVARELRADGYLAKPFDLDQVLDQVEQIFAEWSDTKKRLIVSRFKNHQGQAAFASNLRP